MEKAVVGMKVAKLERRRRHISKESWTMFP